VHAHGIDVGAVEKRLVGGGVVGADLLDQLELAEELRTLRRRGDGRRRLGVEGYGGGLGRRGSSERICAFGAQYRSS
jgi:hypothetical protein